MRCTGDALAKLTLTDARKPLQVPQVVQRRNKLALRVWQQMELAKAQSNGGEYRVTNTRVIQTRQQAHVVK